MKNGNLGITLETANNSLSEWTLTAQDEETFAFGDATSASRWLRAEEVTGNGTKGIYFDNYSSTSATKLILYRQGLSDRVGGRTTLLIGAIGSAIANALMGGFLIAHESIGNALGFNLNLTIVFTVLYAINMYFQSFGAVSIVKVNSAWFHVRERGIIGGIFGILISLGLYFAYDWNGIILDNFGVNYVFLIPAATLLTMFVVALAVVRDTPSKAGLEAKTDDLAHILGAVGVQLAQQLYLLQVGV